MRQVTLLFLLTDDQICLAMKKRGFGAGKYNGMGGKIGEGESIETAAVREVSEEVGVQVAEKDLLKVGELHFEFQNKPDWELNCHTFVARSWTGEPKESEEMAPHWFNFSDIPYDSMWVDDKVWLPHVLTGNFVKAHFVFSEDGSQIVEQTMDTLPL